MFTANSMNSLTEAIGLSLPGNGTILATHKNRIELFKAAARKVVKNAYAYYEDGDRAYCHVASLPVMPSSMP